MAKKIGKVKPTPPPVAPVNELDVLHPEREVMIAGERVMVREYGGVEWMRLQVTAAPIIDRLTQLMETGNHPSFEDAHSVIAGHIDDLLPLISQASGLSVERINELGPVDLENLILAWWGANGSFFVQRAINRVLIQVAEKRSGTLTGANSTPPSSPTVTSSGNSSTTPGDN